MTDLAYRATGRFWAELAACGVTDVVVSPGSRSTPLAVTARNQDGLRVTVQLDERVAGFCALGMAKASGRPVAVVCTSGTAAANLLPAVVEAHHGGVPLVVCTADRPPELRDAGAGQTIDQVKLYGDHVRWFAEMPCDFDDPDYFARLAVRAATAAGAGPNPGPVHLNWPFRKPLEPLGPVPRFGALVGRPVVPVRPLVEADVDTMSRLAGRRGLIVSGALDVDEAGAAAIVGFAEAAGWPVVADAGSQLRAGDRWCWMVRSGCWAAPTWRPTFWCASADRRATGRSSTSWSRVERPTGCWWIPGAGGRIRHSGGQKRWRQNPWPC